MKCYPILSILLLFLTACNSSDRDLKSGTWRATLKTESAAEIPFNFEVVDSAGVKTIFVINAKERLRVDEISLTNDSVFIKMPLFDSEIRAKLYEGKLSGSWIKHLAEKDVAMQFDAKADETWRFFKAKESSKSNMSGRWSAAFTGEDTPDTTIAVGEFQQEGSVLSGTFLTTTGDYRYLQGTISDNKMYLSSFDGGNAYLFTGKMSNDSTIVDGKFYSGYSFIENWTARKDEKAILPDAYSLTGLKDGYNKLSFTFPSLDGKEVSMADEKFKNKVVLVQFLGSWCPNCMDETAYLVPFYRKYKEKGLEIIGLAYERTGDIERSKKNVLRLRDRFNIPYDLLLTGYSNASGEVAKSLPMIDNFMAFPTLIVVDKKGEVRKIHTGFTGPGTGQHYIQFEREFEKSINDLLAE